MASIITIPTPCHEDWNAMTPNEQGRHCGSCVKTVVDFTTWQPLAILEHFETNVNVCGRFKTDQLNEPIPTAEDFVKQIAYFKIPTLKKIAAIFLFAFMIGGSSCNEKVMGDKVIINDSISNTLPVPHLLGDTTYTGHLVGEAVPVDILISDSIKKSKEKEEALIGDVMIKETPAAIGEPNVVIKKDKKTTCSNNENIKMGAVISGIPIKNDSLKEEVMGKMIAMPVSK
jgi:hypothetical protein